MNTASKSPFLIFAVGNESRGDDALGPLLLRAIGGLIESGSIPDQYELIEDFQLQVEHVLDMDERQAVLFIDAGQQTPAPFHFYRAKPQIQIGHSTHALAPEALLPVFEQVLGKAAPPAYVLCVRGDSFELGAGLTPQAHDHYAAALAFVKRLLNQPADEAWDTASMHTDSLH
ncbi:MAG: hydrogenase maturation protease [Methylococcaceae bacterium]|nr:MAG: hydrogenase maturation protease [Methylococcaceae bacterium]